MVAWKDNLTGKILAVKLDNAMAVVKAYKWVVVKENEMAASMVA